VNAYDGPVNFSEHYRPDQFGRVNPIIKTYTPIDETTKHDSSLCGLDKLQFYMIQEGKQISYGDKWISLPPTYGIIHVKLSKLVTMYRLQETDRLSYQRKLLMAVELEEAILNEDNDNKRRELFSYISTIKKKLMVIANEET
jgi:hypothetical protein